MISFQTEKAIEKWIKEPEKKAKMKMKTRESMFFNENENNKISKDTLKVHCQVKFQEILQECRISVMVLRFRIFLGLKIILDLKQVRKIEILYHIQSSIGQFDLGKAKSPDFRIDESLDEDDLGAKARSRTVDNTKFARGHIFEDKKEQKNFIDVALSEITTAADAGNHQQKLLELEVKVKNYQRENKELYNKIREDNEEYLNLNQDYEDIKLKYERMKREYDSLVNERNLEKTGSYGSDKKVKKWVARE